MPVDIHAATLVWPVLGEYVPAGQFIHVAILVAPVAEEYVPTGQSKQAPPLKYFPGGQLIGVVQELAPAADVWPAGHAVQDVAPAAEKLFAGQFIHVAILVAPVAEEYVPAGQFTQAPPLMYFPAGHLHTLAPAADVWPAGHAVQEAAPAVAEKVFARQFLHP